MAVWSPVNNCKMVWSASYPSPPSIVSQPITSSFAHCSITCIPPQVVLPKIVNIVHRWTIHDLLGPAGIMKAGRNAFEIRYLITQHQGLINNMSAGEISYYLKDKSVQKELPFSDPHVALIIKDMIFAVCSDCPSVPKWDRFSVKSAAYIALLCARALLVSEKPLRDLPRCFTGVGRILALRNTIDLVLQQALFEIFHWSPTILKSSSTPR